MEELTTDDKLVMAHFYCLSVLNKEERAVKIVGILNKGYSYGQLSKLWGIPKTTIMGWANPDKYREYHRREIQISEINKEIEKKYKTIDKKPTNDEMEFRKICYLNGQLKTILDIFRDIEKIDNDIAKDLFKRIKREISRLNGNKK